MDTRYEEALERANEAVKRGMVSQNFVDDIFGVESEDERIRRESRKGGSNNHY